MRVGVCTFFFFPWQLFLSTIFPLLQWPPYCGCSHKSSQVLFQAQVPFQSLSYPSSIASIFCLSCCVWQFGIVHSFYVPCSSFSILSFHSSLAIPSSFIYPLSLSLSLSLALSLSISLSLYLYLSLVLLYIFFQLNCFLLTIISFPASLSVPVFPAHVCRLVHITLLTISLPVAFYPLPYIRTCLHLPLHSF